MWVTRPNSMMSGAPAGRWTGWRLEGSGVSFTHWPGARAEMIQRLASAGTDNPGTYTGFSTWLGLPHSTLPSD